MNAMHLWRWAVGLPDAEEPEVLKYEDLMISEWSNEFEKYMRNRLIVGAYRYGKVGQANKPVYDRCGAIAKRIQDYQATGNLDLLVDIANLAMLEFIEGEHPCRHMASEEHRDTVLVLRRRT